MKCILNATTPYEQTKGLSLFPDLKDDEYALFSYDKDTLNAFWNKDVIYPIDIAFYDYNKKLLYKTSMEKDQREPVFSPLPYRYVVETKKGKWDNKFAF